MVDSDSALTEDTFKHAKDRYLEGRWEEAEAGMAEVLRRRQDHSEAAYYRAYSLIQLGRPEEALQCIDEVLFRLPDNSNAHVLRGNALYALGRREESLSSYNSALSRNSENAEAFNGIGVVLQALGRIDESIDHYQRAISLNHMSIAAHRNLGTALHAANENESALASYDRALSLAPDDAETHVYRSFTQLRLGDYESGWKRYAWRWKLPAMKSRHYDAAPAWDGKKSIAGKHILVLGEQGIGDCIHFLRYLPQLQAADAEVEVQVPRTLADLVAHSFTDVRVVPEGNKVPAPDYFVHLMSLPQLLETRLDNVPRVVPYIRAESRQVETWHGTLETSARPSIGLAWAGNPHFARDAERSMPLARLEPLFKLPFAFVSLQVPLSESDRASLAGWQKIMHLGDSFPNFSATAAAIEALDLVISVDTAVAHLAGALNKPVWILLPYSADWRWLTTRSDSPWYPAARLFRQPRHGDWESVIADVTVELRRGWTQ